MLLWMSSGRSPKAAVVVVGLALGSSGCAGGNSPASAAKSGDSPHAEQGDADLARHDQESSDDAATNAKLEGRLRKVKAELPPGATMAQRIALADIAYPENAEENRRLAGFTLLVVTAITHDPAELPPQVRVHHSGGDLALPLLLSRIGTLDPPDLREVFGAHRFDGLYAIPIQAVHVEAQVLANFPNVRRDFNLLQLRKDALRPDIDAIAPGEPDPDAVRAFAEREFPIVNERALTR